MNITTHKIIGLSALLLVGLASGTASSEEQVLTGNSGMALYTFDKDAKNNGKSACLNDCATTWPPAAETEATIESEDFGNLVRPDGFKQLTFRGKPVYLFSGDQQPNQANGDNIGGVWHVIREVPKAAQRKSDSGWNYGSSY
jgi:predicted lipoprotein with Yx(FWY)xxD motif